MEKGTGENLFLFVLQDFQSFLPLLIKVFCFQIHRLPKEYKSLFTEKI